MKKNSQKEKETFLLFTVKGKKDVFENHSFSF